MELGTTRGMALCVRRNVNEDRDDGMRCCHEGMHYCVGRGNSRVYGRRRGDARHNIVMTLRRGIAMGECEPREATLERPATDTSRISQCKDEETGIALSRHSQEGATRRSREKGAESTTRRRGGGERTSSRSRRRRCRVVKTIHHGASRRQPARQTQRLRRGDKLRG
jgi:hypothetical protein